MENGVERNQDVGRTRSGKSFSYDVANIVCNEDRLEIEPNGFGDSWNHPIETVKSK